MNGKQLLLNTMERKPVPRNPWLPFVGCHGASLVGVTADKYLRSADLIVEGQNKARELYRPDGLPVIFDLQLEAEALGCELRWAEDLPPCVATHPLEGIGDVSRLPEFSLDAGRLPMVLEATERLYREMGEDVALFGLITGPFTLATHMRGNDIFLDLYDEPEFLEELLDYCAKVGVAMASAYMERGVDVIAVVD
ncbi:MAG: uroporphyrinogen decarboxylase, partial [Candidatus Sumerlaeia bacterium]|nr:uroporphyrinogen decarboxylase [Candidatus Sumerlaeia bacterium]